MKSTGVTSDGVVHQVLSKDNYERWKIVIQNYLEGQGLWYLVDSTNQASKRVLETVKESSRNHFTDSKSISDLEEGLWGVMQSISEFESEASWKTKNAKALHAIQLSCGREILDEISHFDSAKNAWNYLKSQYGNDLTANPDILQEVLLMDDSGPLEYKEMFRKIERGDFIGNTGMDFNPYVSSASSRSTLLHVAVIVGNVENVEKLVKEGNAKLVCMQDQHGDTALSLVARYTGNKNIAKCMVDKINYESQKELLEKTNLDNVLPIHLAAANGHKELTTYLYDKLTPFEVLDESKNRVLLFSLCITAEIFDVALKLLKRFQNLPDESYGFTDHKLLRRRESFSLPNQNSKPVPQLESSSVKFSVLMELAKMPSVFPSGTQYGHLRQFIYNHLSVDRKFSEDYGITEITNFVQKVTSVDKRHLKTSTNRPLSRYDKVLIVLDFLATLVSGWLFWSWILPLKNELPLLFWLVKTVSTLLFWPVKMVSKLLFWPVKFFGLHLWRILCEIAYLFGKTLKRLYGISEIYEQKCTHYQVIGILSYFSRSIGKLNGQQLKDAYAYEAMLYAAEHGIIEFINAMREAKPALLSAVNSCNRGIFSYAIQYRKQNVFQLIHCLNGRKEMFRYSIDTFGNNMLHLAAHLGPPSDRHSRSGAAMQMQREIQWFKAVEKVLHPKFKEAENDDGKKPYEIFTENHEELVKDGEKWAKDTATSYTIVGTLIITIMFAAAFTVPGGNDQNTGLPIFLHDNVFTTFLIADALSLFASATSVLIFIGILTSRYAEKDFVKNLPWKLMFGLSFLFLSVCSMIVAFCAAIIDMISKGYRTNKWSIIVLIMLLGSIPIIVLVLSQLRLMKEIIHSTWKNRISTIEG
ncbi:unnamed protein product [Trifolium pratense]|uniref:Uncharacterized protein n=1 Tax=Trifolium pratense TaxID=57577 RepID=A0ACB0JQ60_TRIPR|nr:unnamed protein product [Trifolium pratense]